MAIDSVKSQSITNLDATPYVYNSAGQGAAARIGLVDDFVALTTNGLASTGSTYRIIRFPTAAIPKSLSIFTDAPIDSHSTPAVVLDLNIAFSDSTIDGTQVALQGLIPSTLGPASITNTTSYSTPNILFGQFTPTTTGSVAIVEVLFNGINTTYTALNLVQQPLWQTFKFLDGRSNPADPGGYFDLLVYVSTAATTPHAANMWAKLTYAKT